MRGSRKPSDAIPIRYVSTAEFDRRVAEGATLYRGFAITNFERLGGKMVAYAVKADELEA